ncbi:hypothetical protein C7M84_006649 [Penaeus vannamei]|uniref:Uncharacterized protein n=1 Tax=Penaeus vannamei TaxID=6689 RepID=A0A423TEF9_PENVA|nr:hypothetical protein C7M84_006649 [Penaeus vannamei]
MFQYFVNRERLAKLKVVFCGYLLIPPQVLSGVYLTPLINHTCLPPLLEDPVEISSDSCSYFVNNSSSGEAEEFSCTEWEYDTSVYTNTLTSESDGPKHQAISPSAPPTLPIYLLNTPIVRQSQGAETSMGGFPQRLLPLAIAGVLNSPLTHS